VYGGSAPDQPWHVAIVLCFFKTTGVVNIVSHTNKATWPPCVL